MPTSAAISSSFGKRAIATIAPTAPTFAVDLTASTAEFGLTRFFRPVAGVSFLKSGLIACSDGLKPTWPTLATTPAAAQTNTIGAMPTSTCPPIVMNSSPIPLRSTTLGSLTRSRIPTVASAMRWYMPGPKADRARTDASITTAPLMSCERETWPFLRASWRFFGVAFSVLFSAISAGHLQGVQSGGHGALQLVAEPAGHERQRGADEDQADGDLGREADAEDVELRHDARDEAEGDVGEQHGEHDRRADLDGRAEDAAERDLHALDERGHVRRLGQRDRLVGPGEALDHPGVAVDDDEDHHADQRVQLVEDAAVGAVDGVDERAEREADQRVEDAA